MPQTVIGSQWFDEAEAASILELPIETVHTFYERMLADKRVPVAYHKGAGIPMLNGYTIMALKGLPQQLPPVSKRRHAR